jgi:hypothetical protein
MCGICRVNDVVVVVHCYVLVKCFTNLYDGADLLLITGRIGMSVLCSCSCALNVSVEGFFCVRYLVCRLSMIKLHSCIVLNISFWYLSVGSLVSVRKLLVLRNVCIFSEYSSEFMITIVWLCQLG